MYKKIILASITSSLFFSTFIPVIYASENSDYEGIQEVNAPSNVESIYPDVSEERTDSSNSGQIAKEEDGSHSLSEEEQVNSSTSETKETFDSSSHVKEKNLNQEKGTTESQSNLKELQEGEISVSDWEEFYDAFSNPSVRKITLTNNIVKNHSPYLNFQLRTNSIEIDGGGFELDFNKSDYLALGAASSNENVFKLHNISIKNNDLYPTINFKTLDGYSAKWRFEIGNLNVQSGSVHSILHAPLSEVMIFGSNTVHTLFANFTIGSAVFADETIYTGVSTNPGAPLFDYQTVKVDSSATGAKREFRTGKNSVISLKNETETPDASTSAIKDYFRSILVEEETVLDIFTRGAAIRFGTSGLENDKYSMIIKDGAKVNLNSDSTAGIYAPTLLFEGPNSTKEVIVESGGSFDVYQSRNDRPLILFRGNNTNLQADPGSIINLVGNSSEGYSELLLSMISVIAGSEKNKMVFNKPAYFNLQNKNKGSSAIKPWLSDFTFTILDAGVSLWGIKDTPSEKDYPLLSSFKLEHAMLNGGDPNETLEEVLTYDRITIEDQLGKTERFLGLYNRISGVGDFMPFPEWNAITDAEKTGSVRVVVGYKPGDSPTDQQEKIYASKDMPVKVDFYDQQNHLLASDILLNDEGIASHDFKKFHKANSKLKATARIGELVTEQMETVVIDATPPDPAVIDGGNQKVTSTKELSGTGEIGSVVTLERNGEPVAIPETIVDNDGKWKIDLSNVPLERSDQLQVFLQDNAGSLVGKVSEVPETNNEQGNRNPKKEKVTYKDAKFEIGTIVNIVGELIFKEVPTVIDFGQQVVKSEEQTFTPEAVTGQLIISDTRGSNATWKLLLSEKTPLTVGERSLTDVFEYQLSDGTLIKINDALEVIETGDIEQDGDFELSSNWNKQHGLIMKVPVQKQLLGAYEGVLSWELQDVPGNP
ncbi:pectate lyase-like adhesive domain-containing protein [Enterococcus sp. LJL98]